MILYRKCFKSGQQRHCHIEFSLLVFQTQVMQNLSSIDRVDVDDAVLVTLRYICKFLLSLRSFQSIVIWVPRRRIFVVNPDVVDLKDQNLHYEIFGTTFYSIFIQNGANHFRFNSILKNWNAKRMQCLNCLSIAIVCTIVRLYCLLHQHTDTKHTTNIWELVVHIYKLQNDKKLF